MFELQELDQKVKYDLLLVPTARYAVTPSGISQWGGGEILLSLGTESGCFSPAALLLYLSPTPHAPLKSF